MKPLTGISQGFDKSTKATLMTASALNYDHDIIITKSA